ncbi:uncharacterized protein SEPMUDRAFT_124676 [Sphaerulina musiva SO2202]|uniref:Uncharacterized protein n=1 Tax=Sphaerulina musiva (strain SO2202) TaxID=692275 RepID=M3B428_SPHMS|nr:uncharacterized protein SEPMUDRAFT_124676 [Sphaerulina musiva SO2202]EMF14527.1 hypothetical protein SEPMUDRAFT_124676 [Sphaerulina musiva SO2202]
MPGCFVPAEAFPGYPGRSGLHQIPQTSRRQAAAYAVVAECDPRRDKSMRRVSFQANRNCWSKAWIKRSTRLAAWCFRHRFPQDQNRRIAFGMSTRRRPLHGAWQPRGVVIVVVVCCQWWRWR